MRQSSQLNLGLTEKCLLRRVFQDDVSASAHGLALGRDAGASKTAFFIVPTLQRGNASHGAPAPRSLVAFPWRSSAAYSAQPLSFPRSSVGTHPMALQRPVVSVP